MRQYLKNSPEAVSRLIAFAMLTDAEVDDREIDILDRIDFYRSVGINKWAFGEVLADLCDDLARSADRRGRIRLVDKKRIEHVLAEVDDPSLRAQTVALITNVLRSDGKLAPQEAAFLRYVLSGWKFAPEASSMPVITH